MGLFDEHLTSLYDRLRFEPHLFLAARRVSLTTTVPLRTLDALHVAACMEQKQELATFDDRLAAAARQFGLTVRP